MSSSSHETAQNKFCCTYDEVLLNLEQPIAITNADKIQDGSSYYIAYHIQFSSFEVRRRYSEFESLRDALSKLYPAVLVPPIPDKHSIAQYATKQTRAKEDVHVIDKRKRMLQSFLNRIVAHPILASEHGLQRKLLDSSKDFGDLGAIYNGFSLAEKEGLAETIEKLGQAVDISYMALGDLSAGLEEAVSEPLEEYAKYSVIAQRALKYRSTKHLQLERATEMLEIKKAARGWRLLFKGKPRRGTHTRMMNRYTLMTKSDALVQLQSLRREAPRSISTGDVAQNVNGGGGGHLLNLLSYTLHGLIDVDPEGSRRNSITKTKEQILGLENLVENLTNGLEMTSAALQRDLDRFQAQKQADLTQALSDFARLHREYCQAVSEHNRMSNAAKNLRAWEEALAEAEKIPTGAIPCRAFVKSRLPETP
ncbi:Sorting nexin, cytoplasm-to-vacuole targeting pathway/endosomal sorting [Massospora cicadina]|nr:Sorting nexin, cytoplasm-to-vacuole targeting pathway/endosomal sorting [Massospora cicadina]